MTIERRNYDATLEIRSEGDGRTIVGIAVPYDVEQRISPNLVEVFRKGVFRDVTRAANRVKLLFQHKTDAPIGRAIMLEERDGGLYGEFRISKTEAGDEALELIRDGVLSNLSVGFQPLKDEKRSGVVNRIKAHLAEVSLVTFGAYGDAANIVAVRQEIEKPNLASIEQIVAKVRK
jgi:HK97 family phage prohead protease